MIQLSWIIWRIWIYLDKVSYWGLTYFYRRAGVCSIWTSGIGLL